MEITFYKYQGTGNDFIMIDNRGDRFPKKNTTLINRLCDRRFGIGADGLILLEDDKISDFRMVYYNSDGNESSMCGNGGRCFTSFAQYLGVITNETNFMAVDGLHHATIADNGEVSLQMKDVSDIRAENEYVFLDTGSPHHVELADDLQAIDLKQEGSKIRYGLYGNEGSNVNFVSQVANDEFAVRTYERGVEDETLSCGTGVTAVAIAMHFVGKTSVRSIRLQTPGGILAVSFDHNEGRYSNVRLAGPAEMVFTGKINLG